MKSVGISSLAERLLASQKMCSVEVVRTSYSFYSCYMYEYVIYHFRTLTYFSVHRSRNRYISHL